eukprot:TRINITY_DN492_c0_g3_i1.p1 TRINITY_DN492_c0_g3~~TRINITY_DN492_c0_g3_i1.p1  ORF type:complete len:723 (-),score=319.86 TRINITY_DN492_c0_g3_i1:56-2224(-)
MGKKKKDKKGQGKVKTELKTEKNESKKLKKFLEETGEDEIDIMLANFRRKDAERVTITEHTSEGGPSPRVNASLVAHPFKNELILFGGEFYNGDVCTVFNDLFFFNLKTKEWKQVLSPNSPQPRCSHQAVIVEQNGGQMWIFGGEFTSPSETQFHHYKDLWVLHLNKNAWEEINVKNGPKGRSGHRMVYSHSTKSFIVFGGYVDNGRDIKYNNELHIFDLEKRIWRSPTNPPIVPEPRSGFQMATYKESVIIHGGYSVERKAKVEIGIAHTDLWSYNLKTSKWTKLKPAAGVKPPPVSGCSATFAKERLFLFGGVFDEDVEEDLQSIFSNELFTLDLSANRWSLVELRGKQKPVEGGEKKKRRRTKKKEEDPTKKEEENSTKKEEDATKKVGEEEEEEKNVKKEEEGEEDVEKNDEEKGGDNEKEGDEDEEDDKEKDDDKDKGDDGEKDDKNEETVIKKKSWEEEEREFEEELRAKYDEPSEKKPGIIIPVARRNGMMTFRGGKLYLYGGIQEDSENNKDYTLNDLHALDITKLQEWEVIIPLDLSSQTWVDEESDDDDDEDEDDEDEEDIEEEGKPKKKKEKKKEEIPEEADEVKGKKKKMKKNEEEVPFLATPEEEQEEVLQDKDVGEPTTKKKKKKKKIQEEEEPEELPEEVVVKTKKKTKTKSKKEDEEETPTTTTTPKKKKKKTKDEPEFNEEEEEEEQLAQVSSKKAKKKKKKADE